MARIAFPSLVKAAKIGGAGIVVVAALAAVNRLAAQQQGPSPYPSGPLPSGAVVAHDDTPANTALPANFPDRFAWKLFLEVNKRAEHQSPIGGKAGNPMSNDAVWETWADDTLTFPAGPDPSKPPQWPAAGEVPNKAKTLAPPLSAGRSSCGRRDSRSGRMYSIPHRWPSASSPPVDSRQPTATVSVRKSTATR